QFLTSERGFSMVATGESFPGISTRIYPFGGGGFLEVAYISDESKIAQSEGGLALQSFLTENGDGYYSFVLETDDYDHVKQVLLEEEYPFSESGVQHVTDPSGQTNTFRMLGTFPHLPWFVQYREPRKNANGFPQAVILRTTTLTADATLLEKIMQTSSTQLNFPNMMAILFPLANATLRLEAADAYSFAYFDTTGILLEKPLLT
ncbi:MAG: VOC family protein, partial [Clostridia bacterium]